MVLSLILAEFFKGAYKAWDQSHHWRTSLTLLACAIFLSKQVADLFLYYRLSDDYDPSVANENRTFKLLRLTAENSQELSVLFLTYGAIQELTVQNLDQSMNKYHQLTRAAGSGLLLSIALVEFSWLFWDFMYIWKRVRNINDIRSRGSHKSWRELWVDNRKNGRVLLWTVMNGSSAVAFLLLWCYFHYSDYYPNWTLDTSIPDTGIVLLWLLLPVTAYFFIYHIVLRNYYLGEV